jgi:hypothetical protein
MGLIIRLQTRLSIQSLAILETIAWQKRVRSVGGWMLGENAPRSATNVLRYKRFIDEAGE